MPSGSGTALFAPASAASISLTSSRLRARRRCNFLTSLSLGTDGVKAGASAEILKYDAGVKAGVATESFDCGEGVQAGVDADNVKVLRRSGVESVDSMSECLGKSVQDSQEDFLDERRISRSPCQTPRRISLLVPGKA